MKVIGLMGPSTGGKSTILQGVLTSLRSMHPSAKLLYRPIATYLKDEAAEKFGWDGTKVPAQRKILQNTSEVYKKEFGEDIFIAKCAEFAVNSNADVLVFDDLRHAVEVTYLNRTCYDVTLINIVEPIAETLWENAFRACRTEDDEYAWATHRSELEWRGFRHMYPSVFNDKTADTGLTNSVNSVLNLAGLSATGNQSTEGQTHVR